MNNKGIPKECYFLYFRSSGFSSWLRCLHIDSNRQCRRVRCCRFKYWWWVSLEGFRKNWNKLIESIHLEIKLNIADTTVLLEILQFPRGVVVYISSTSTCSHKMIQPLILWLEWMVIQTCVLPELIWIMPMYQIMELRHVGLSQHCQQVKARRTCWRLYIIDFFRIEFCRIYGIYRTQF